MTGLLGASVLLIAIPLAGAIVLLVGGRLLDRVGHLIGCATVLASFVLGLLIFFGMVGEPAGLDQLHTVPVYTWSETHYLADAAVNKAAYYALTGKTNNAGWNGYAAGEVLFLGASGSKRGDSDWEITFRFAASPNRANFSVGGITVASKKGWEYMWVRYQDSDDAAAKMIIKKPVAVYIEKVYEEGSFASLGIGG